MTGEMTIINGQVLDPHHRPEVEASVYIISAPISMPDIAQLTDEQGRFTLSAPVPGRYTLGVRSDRWGATQIIYETCGEDELVIEVQFTLTEGTV